MTVRLLSLVLLSASFLGGCSVFESQDSNKSVLEGERLSLYDFEKSLQSDPNTKFGMDGMENQSVITLPENLKGGDDENISLVAPWSNKFWPQVGGYANHAMKHVAFTADEPKRIWSRDIGKGSTNRHPMTAAPVMAENIVFGMNNKAQLTAVDAQTGEKIWDADISKPGEDELVIGGGIAFSGGRVFATNGFNELIALDAKSGEILWRTATNSPVRAAPAAIPTRVFITTMDNETLAFDTQNGRQLWSHRGLSGDAGILGAPTPALTREAVITAYSSGEIYALQIDTGVSLWSENLSPLAREVGQNEIHDIRALPVIDNGVVYASSYSSRMSAIMARTGQEIWHTPLGSASTPWVSGNRIFMIETQGTLISLNRENGQFIWQSALPRFEDEKNREGLIHWTGPYLAGNRLMVFGSHGMVQSYNPVDGSLVREWSIGGDVTLAPAIAGETLYILDENGRLSAWQ